MSRCTHAATVALLISVATVGCKRHGEAGARVHDAAAPVHVAPPIDAAPTPPPIPVVWYRAAVGTGDQEVPFFLSTPPAGTGGGCAIVNGDEHIAVDCTWKDGAHLELAFPVFATSIQATRTAYGSLAGTWQMSRISGARAPAPFAATPIPRPDPTLRFPPAEHATSPADFAGTWSFQFAALDTGKGTLAQTADGVVTGTIIPQSIGDMRYLAGNARGDTLWLSTFDGQHAYVVHAELDARRQGLKGAWTFSQIMTDTFTARRVPSLDIAIVETLRLRPGAKHVTIPQLDDPRYRGKPVIVDYFGTWCPACMDETPYLLDLYRRQHPHGLEILSIALEGTTDDAYNQHQVDYFRKRYGIPWQIVVVPGDYEDTEKLLPKELEGTGGYPITIFLDRDRHVRGLHSGFFGPAAGDDYRQLIQTFERYVTEMLATP